MANPLKGEAEVKLDDGRVLKLVSNTAAWIAAEVALERRVSTPEIIEELQSGKASLETQRALMYGMLRKHHPEIDLDESGELLIEAAAGMQAALGDGLPKGEEGSEDAPADPPKRRTRGTGTSPSPRGPASASAAMSSTM